jgi:hypothetical protein
MTVDPDGAMHDWVDPPDGWSIVKIPTQELVPMLGIAAYQELLVELCEAERPAALVTHPPYDYLDARTAARIKAAGTRLVGYAFDDEIFPYDEPTRAALRASYDRYATTRDVRWATAPDEPIAREEAQHDVVLVGRAYARRRELVDELRAAGIDVVTAGHGWPGGFVTRRGLRQLYARARIVLTTGDWEDHPVDMVKHRLLDTAMLGAFQIAQASPDLRAYFPPGEVPSYGSSSELVDAVNRWLPDEAGRRSAAAAARARCLAEHTWKTRLPELVGALVDHPAPGRARLLGQAVLALATRAEASNRIPAAAALFALVDDPLGWAGLGRCLRDLGDVAGSIGPLRRALAAPQPIAAAMLDAHVPTFGVGAGLGRLGLFPPAAEPAILLVASLCELGRAGEAAALIGELPPATARVVARVIQLGDDPALAPVEAALRTWRR